MKNFYLSSRRIVWPAACLAIVLAVVGLTSCEKQKLSADQVRLVDLKGQPVDPFDHPDAKATVFLFARHDCPIGNRLAPEVARICEAYAPQGVEFRIVYPSPTVTVEEIEQHLKEYAIPCEALRDPEHQLVDLVEAKVAPEVFVFVPGRSLVYRGRINDQYVDFGKTRAEPTSHDLRDALDAALAGKPVANPVTKAVGCFIDDLKK